MKDNCNTERFYNSPRISWYMKESNKSEKKQWYDDWNTYVNEYSDEYNEKFDFENITCYGIIL